MSGTTRVLVSGSSGFIGSALVGYLLDRGIPVCGLDSREPPLQEQRASWTAVDILDQDRLTRAVASFGPTHLVHLAARTDLGLDATLDDFRANTDGVANMVQACREIPALQAAMFASTILVCRAGYLPSGPEDFCPNTPYGESKVVGEQMVRERLGRSAFTWSIVRPTSIWGPGFGSHYLGFFRAIARGWYLHPGKVNNRVVYGYIGNCVHQIWKILTAGPETHQQVFYLGDYQPLELQAWAGTICRAAGRKRVRVMPQPLLRAAAGLGDILWRLGWKGVPLTSFRLANMSTDRLYDTSNTEAVAGPLPYTLEQAVEQTLGWLRERGEIR